MMFKGYFTLRKYKGINTYVDRMISQWRIQDFPMVGTPTLQDAPTHDFAKFSQKLHEIERIWTGRGAGPKFYYVDPPQ